MANNEPLLDIKDLKTYFFLDEGTVKAVDGISFSIRRGETTCVVGESGCGKTVMGRSILQIVDPPGRIVSGSITLHLGTGGSDGSQPPQDIVLTDYKPTSRAMRVIRGSEISMIFQEPLAALSPVHTIGNQIMEAMQVHLSISKKEARQRAVEMLSRVGIPKPEQRIDNYAFQLSGGMRQRAMIAIALVCNPSLLIADEPTTALDVTTQAQILDLLHQSQQELGMSVMLITHDLGVVAEVADSVIVMYLGSVVEQGDVRSIFHDPKHPYTRALLRSIPQVGIKSRQRLDTISGMVPHSYNRPAGCAFHTRCDRVIAGLCDVQEPPHVLVGQGREVRCWLYGEKGGE